jgi:hypothetical protein
MYNIEVSSWIIVRCKIKYVINAKIMLIMSNIRKKHCVITEVLTPIFTA